MNEHATADDQSKTRKATRPLWPWIAGTFALFVFAAALYLRLGANRIN